MPHTAPNAFDHGVEFKTRGPIWLGVATPRPLVMKLVCRTAPAEQPLPLQHAARRRSSSQWLDFVRSQIWGHAYRPACRKRSCRSANRFPRPEPKELCSARNHYQPAATQMKHITAVASLHPLHPDKVHPQSLLKLREQGLEVGKRGRGGGMTPLARLKLALIQPTVRNC